MSISRINKTLDEELKKGGRLILHLCFTEFRITGCFNGQNRSNQGGKDYCRSGEQPMKLVLNRAVTFTGCVFQPLPIDDLYFLALICNKSGLLESTGDEGY